MDLVSSGAKPLQSGQELHTSFQQLLEYLGIVLRGHHEGLN